MGAPVHRALLALRHRARYISAMAKRPSPLSSHIDISSPKFLNSFWKTSDAFDKKHAATPEAALKQRVKEKVLTRSGKLTRHDSGK